MDIKEIIKLQHNFDSKHNWSLKTNGTNELIEIINKDLIGIYGELGEFSNLIKKLNLNLKRDNEKLDELFQELRPDLEEELIDTFIYLIRIATHLEINITDKYLEKLNINKVRFAKYESDYKE